jgi:hypothetical protein
VRGGRGVGRRLAPSATLLDDAKMDLRLGPHDRWDLGRPGLTRGREGGRRMAYVEVLDLMKLQAEAFNLPLADLTLDGFNPEDLLRP